MKKPLIKDGISTRNPEEKADDTLEIITHRLGFKYGITKVVNGKKLETHYPLNRHELNP